MIVLDWQMHEAVAAIAAIGVSPIVRIAANEGWMVKSVFHHRFLKDMRVADSCRSIGFRSARSPSPASLHRR